MLVTPSFRIQRTDCWYTLVVSQSYEKEERNRSQQVTAAVIATVKISAKRAWLVAEAGSGNQVMWMIRMEEQCCPEIRWSIHRKPILITVSSTLYLMTWTCACLFTIFLPSLLLLLDACNSPNCNFKMQHPTAASSGNNSGTPGAASAMSQRRFTTGGTTVSSQAVLSNAPNASALALLSSTPRSSSYLHHPQHPLHVTSSANHTVPLTNYHLPLPAGRGFQSLFPRPGDAISSHFNRFTSMHSSSHHPGGESASAAGITYNRLNPLFETTEGSFRSAYPWDTWHYEVQVWILLHIFFLV